MTYKYREMKPTEHGNTVSCESLARELNGIADYMLTRKVSRHIHRYFARVLEFTHIPDAAIRKEVAKLLIYELDTKPLDVVCPAVVGYIIRNVKLAYIKDKLVNEIPLNYKSKLS